ncbi:MAG: tetratricopeptide repeat protein [Candidatus Acidiferrum sp.]
MRRETHSFFYPALLFWLGLCYAPRLLFAQNASQQCVPQKSLGAQLQAHPTAATYDALGNYYNDRKEFPCAVCAFRESLKLKPNSPQTHYSLALALLAEGDATNAILEFRQSLQLQPDQPEARLMLGVALGQNNQMDDAIQEFQQVLKSDPQSVAAFDCLAKAYMSENRYPAAVALLKQAPPDQSLEIDLVMAYSNNGDNEHALQLLAKMEQEHPESALPHSAMANIYAQQRRYEDAAKEFQADLRLNPKDEAAKVSVIRVLLLQAKFDLALPYAQDYWQTNPNDFDANYLFGVINRELGKYSEAKTLLEIAVKLNAQNYLALYNLGLVYARLGDAAHGRTQLEQAIQINPSSAEAHFQLAAILRSLSLPDEARAQLTQYQDLIAERDRYDVAAAKANQARESLRKGDTQSAVELYRAAIEKDSNNARLYYDFSVALERLGDHDGEHQAILKSIELDPKFAPAHNQLGLLDLQAGQTVGAEKEFGAAISLNPHDVEARNNLGILYGQQGRDAEAAQLFQAAIENDPRYAPSYVNLAVAFASLSRFSEAQSALKKALELEPDNPGTQALLSQVQSRLERQSNDHP